MLSHYATVFSFFTLDTQDIRKCMVCARPFHFFRRKHHCYTCGDICCKSCCRGRLLMTEYREFGGVPACKRCDQGQVCESKVCTESTTLLFVEQDALLIMMDQWLNVG